VIYLEKIKGKEDTYKIIYEDLEYGKKQYNDFDDNGNLIYAKIESKNGNKILYEKKQQFDAKDNLIFFEKFKKNKLIAKSIKEYYNDGQLKYAENYGIVQGAVARVFRKTREVNYVYNKDGDVEEIFGKIYKYGSTIKPIVVNFYYTYKYIMF